MASRGESSADCFSKGFYALNVIIMLVNVMASLTLCVPQQVLARMRRHSEVKWSEVVRAVIVQQLDEWERAEEIASKSRLSQKDVDELALAVDRDLAKHFKAV